MSRHARSLALTVFVAVALLLAVITAAITETVTAASCGSGAKPRHMFAGIWLALSGDPSVFATAGDCVLPVTLIRVLDLLAALALLLALIAGLMIVVRYRQSDHYFVTQLRARNGFASRSEVRKHMSARAMLQRASFLRPGLTSPRPTDVGWRVGRSGGLDVFVSIEDSLALEGPPRSGKGFRVLISAILDWAGPLITTSTTTDNLTATMHLRAQRGRVYVFDPQGLSGVRGRVRIDPIAGCEDPLVAMQRGTAIVTGTALGASSTNQEWAQAAGTILARLLHAAAVGRRTVADLYNWGSTPGLAQAAVDILRADGAPGWGESLDAILSGDEKLLSNTWFGVQGAVAPLAIPAIRESLIPSPGEPTFDADEFLAGENTLYLLGSASGAGAMGGFLSAILDDIVEVARRKALASPNARLQLPLGLILDEIANMFRWAGLPRIMADGGGRGICTFVVLQALSQAETAWSRAEADTIWAAATAKVLLGGASQVAHLRDIEALLGQRERTRESLSWSTAHAGVNSSEQHERLPLMSVDEIRRMPQSMGLLAYRNRRGVLLDLAGWDERADAGDIRRGKATAQAEQLEVFQERAR